jgi:hypothetical protein
MESAMRNYDLIHATRGLPVQGPLRHFESIESVSRSAIQGEDRDTIGMYI